MRCATKPRLSLASCFQGTYSDLKGHKAIEKPFQEAFALGIEGWPSAVAAVDGGINPRATQSVV